MSQNSGKRNHSKRNLTTDKVPEFVKELMATPANEFARAAKLRTIIDSNNQIDEQSKVSPEFQLQMFLDLGSDQDRWQYSNLLALWDQIPKGTSYGGVSDTASVLNSAIEFRGKNIIVEQMPAQMQRTVDGVEIIEFVYPGKSEEVILDAIRYLCVRENDVTYSDSNNGFTFQFITHQIYTYLQSINKTHSHAQIKMALEVLSKSHLTIYNADKTESFSSTLITNMYMNKNKVIGRVSEDNALIALQMHALFTIALKEGQFLPFNNELGSKLKSSLSTLMFRIMSADFRGATRDRIFPFDCKQTVGKSIYNRNCTTMTAQKKICIKSVEELIKHNIIVSYEVIDSFGRNGKLNKCVIQVVPSQAFIDSMIKSNSINKTRQEKKTASRKAIHVPRHTPTQKDLL